MGILINAAVAIVCWLGLFQPHLIQPLAVLPLSVVLENLTAVDYALLLATFVAITIGMDIFDHFTKKPNIVRYENVRGPKTGK